MLLSITDAVVPSKFSHSSVSRRAILDKTNTRHVLTRDKIFVTLNFIVGRTIIDISRAAVVLLQALGEPVKPLRTVEMRGRCQCHLQVTSCPAWRQGSKLSGCD